MEAFATHVVIVGGPEVEDELLALVLDDGQAVPLFDSTEEAQEFLDSTGDFGRDWQPREVSARELADLLEYQDEEVRHVALSPPPERMTGGMEVQVLDREVFATLLERQMALAEQPAEPEPEQPSESRGFLRRLFRR